jgi:hypothetical protein
VNWAHCTSLLTVPRETCKNVLPAKVGREDIFKPTIGNESLHEISNDNGVRLVNFATAQNLRVKSGKTHIQIGHILVDRRRHSNVLDVRSFRAGYCVSDHYLVVAKVRVTSSE